MIDIFLNSSQLILNIITNIIYISWILVIIIGFVKSVIKFCKSMFIKELNSHKYQNDIRVLLWWYILLWLDFIIIADIIKSVLNTEMNQLYALWLIVLIRIAIAYFLWKELGDIE